jgi:hypothetical protein
LIVGLFVIGKLIWLMGLDIACRDWARSLDYRLDDEVLAVSSCFTLGRLVLWRQELRIPPAKITDVKLVQGPILSYLYLWFLRVQTAGMGSPLPETTLYALENPHQACDQILQVIKDANRKPWRASGVEVAMHQADAMSAAFYHAAAMPPEKLPAECMALFCRREGDQSG